MKVPRIWAGYETWQALKCLPTSFVFPGGLQFYDMDSGVSNDVRELITLAVNGNWHATGRRKIGDGTSPSKPEVIPPESWEYLILDIDTGTASGGGIEFVGLRWHNSPPPQPTKMTIAEEASCTVWLTEKMKQPRNATVTKLHNEASIKFTGLSDRAFKRAMINAKKNNTIDPTWKTSGPIRSS